MRLIYFYRSWRDNYRTEKSWPVSDILEYSAFEAKIKIAMLPPYDTELFVPLTSLRIES